MATNKRVRVSHGTSHDGVRSAKPLHGEMTAFAVASAGGEAVDAR